MSGFLEEVAVSLLRDYDTALEPLTVVFPNRRAGTFFSDIYAQRASHAGWGPQVLTFEELAGQLSDLMLADHLTLVYRLYESFRKHAGTDEAFDRFYFWGDILLSDFSEVDMAMVEAADIFTNLSDLKALDAGYDYLDETQKQTIARFWKSFQPVAAERKTSGAQQQFLHLWNTFLPVYLHFREHLLEEGLAYEGLMYRTLAEDMQNLNHKIPGQLILVGMNALKRAEEHILVRLVKDYRARVFWDYDRHFVTQGGQETGMFLRKYLKHPVLGATFPEDHPDHFHLGNKREVSLQGVTLEVGQAKRVGAQLEKLAAQQDFTPEKVAIILTDQRLLFPMLHSLPPAIQHVNVTMGYPLRNTSLFSFIEHLLNLQLEKRKEAKVYRYHHSTLLALLRHPYVRNYAPASATRNIQHIERKNAVYMHPEEMQGTGSFYAQLLRPVETVATLFEYLKEIGGLIHQMVEPGENDQQEEMTIPMLERELLYHFYLQVNRLQGLTRERQFDFQLPSFIRLLRQMFQALRVPFTGEPLRGLQIMGLLESRNLDFDYVFVLSANEGILPAGDTHTSFIPQNLKKGFGLFTAEQQDAFYAYAFFRLLQRARRIFLFYNTEDMQHLSGEMSRFLYQLVYESQVNDDDLRHYPDLQSDLQVSQSVRSIPLATKPAQPIVIDKHNDVWEKLLAFTTSSRIKGKQQRLTPSALNTFLDCRLKFYFQYVVRLQETDQVEEEVNAAVFGNILHKIMEVLYTDHMRGTGKKELSQHDCQQLKGKPLDEAILKGFKEHYELEDGETDVFSGRNAIAREIVRKMAWQILDHDSRYAPFEIQSLEARGAEGFTMDVTVPTDTGSVQVALKGIIDRIDRKENVVRVLDYKTGRDDRSVTDIPSLFDRDHPQRNKAGMQAMFYALLFTNNNATGHDQRITPGLINATELFKDELDSRLQLAGQPLDNFVTYQDIFYEQLIKLIQEIFDQKEPFDQTSDEKKCSICPYYNICY
jgi:hypothetical protein